MLMCFSRYMCSSISTSKELYGGTDKLDIEERGEGVDRRTIRYFNYVIIFL